MKLRAPAVLVPFVFLALSACGGGSGGGGGSGSGSNVSSTAKLPVTTYSVTYNGSNSSGGSTPSDSNSYSSGSPVTVLRNVGNMTKTGYYFLGWSTNSAAITAQYTPGQTFTVGSSNVTLYAVWSPVPPSVTVSPATSSPSTNWANVVVGGGGYVTGLVFHPTSPNLLYARTDIGGIYRWDNSNSTWIPLTDFLSRNLSGFMGAESIALDPTNDQIVYMTAGQYIGDPYYGWHPGNGALYASSNQGATWTSYSLPFPVGSNNSGRAIGERLAVDPNLPSTLYYGSRTAGLWKSTDSGAHWSQVTSLSLVTLSSYGAQTVGVESVLFDTSTTNSGSATQTIYVAVAPDYQSGYSAPTVEYQSSPTSLTSSLYKTTDGGATWTPVTVPVSSSLYIPHMARASDGMLYIEFDSGEGPSVSGPGFVYKFDGVTWTKLLDTHTRYASGSLAGFGGLSVSGSGAGTKIIVGVSNTWGFGQDTILRSSDAGATWTEIGTAGTHTSTGYPYVNPDSAYFGWIDDAVMDPLNPDRVFYVYGGGIWSTTSAFSSSSPAWKFNVDGLEETANLALMTPPSSAPYLLLSGDGDDAGFVHTSLTNSPASYTDRYLTNATGVDLAWQNPNFVVMVGTHSSASVGVYSNNAATAGSSWTSFSAIPGATTNYGDASSVAVTADGSTIIWAIQSTQPYYSTDNGASWKATNLPAPASGAGYHLAADRINPNKVYAYDFKGHRFYYSKDGGHTFTAGATGFASGDNDHTDLAVNPYTEGDVWLADSSGTLYHSVDSGLTWETVTLTGGAAYRVALGKPALGSTYTAAVYLAGTIASTTGVFRSDDQGLSWTRINDDQHQYGAVTRLAADLSTYGRVYTSTTGRGVVYNTP